MRQILRFAAVFAASAAFAAGALADPYSVRNLVVDMVAPSAPVAQQQGKDEARITGAKRLIDRLTLPQDLQAAREPVDPLAISRLTRTSTVQSEFKTSSVAGGVRAQGVVQWNFLAADVRKYLEARGVPYVDTQAALALVVPVAGAGIDPKAWDAQWTETVNGQVVGKTDDTVLTPYVGSVSTWNRRPTWMETQEEATRVRADHGIIAEAFMQGAQYYVRLLDMRTGVADPNMGLAGPFPDIASAQEGAVREMERAWKMASIVRTTGSTNLSVIATFADITEWVKIRKGLETSRLVKGLNVESLSSIGADITFTYAGRPEQLAADLRARGVDLSNSSGGWVLRVAAAQ